MRTETQPLLTVQEAEEAAEAAVADGAMWQEHLQAVWSQMTKHELEEEVKWRSEDQMALEERIKYPPGRAHKERR